MRKGSSALSYSIPLRDPDPARGAPRQRRGERRGPSPGDRGSTLKRGKKIETATQSENEIRRCRRQKGFTTLGPEKNKDLLELEDQEVLCSCTIKNEINNVRRESPKGPITPTRGCFLFEGRREGTA